MSEGECAGSRAVVTGGDRGMGLGIATRLAEQGAEVCLVARDADALDEARSAVGSTGASCTTIVADLADLGEATGVADQLGTTGPWDILVNDAGNPPGPVLVDLPVELWDETFGRSRPPPATAPTPRRSPLSSRSLATWRSSGGRTT